MNALGILVVYDKDRTDIAIERFKSAISSLSGNYLIKIVSNNNNFEMADIVGSNNLAEFSGWNEGLDACKPEAFDIVVFANDTFYTNRRFEQDAFNKFKAKCLSGRDKFIIGEVCYAIDYKMLKKRKKFLLRWIRTSIFAISKEALSELKYVGIDRNKIEYYLSFGRGSSFIYSDDINKLIQNRINDWIFPPQGSTGWHSANSGDDTRLLLKARCVLQELLLTIRCETNGIGIIDYRSQFSFRKIVLKVFYFLQKLFPN